MSLFNWNDDDSTDDEQTFEREPTIEVDVEKTAEYTEHKGVAAFTDGTTEEFTFDSMNRDSDAIVLKRYTDVYESSSLMLNRTVRMPNFESEAFLTLPLENLKAFETVSREEKEWEYTGTKEIAESEVGDNE